jgi:pilus assembly protein CpaB
MARLQEMAMNRGNRMLLFLALGAGLVAAVLVFVALSQNDDGGGTVSGGGSTSAVVANQDINAGTIIASDMVETKDISDDQLISGVVTDSATVVGQAARVKIYKGEQLASGKVGAENDGDGLSFVVPAGKRAVSVDVEEVTAVGGLLLPGNKVDLVLGYPIKGAPELGENQKMLRVETILQNVEVLAVAQTAQEAAPVGSDPADGQTATSGEVPEDVDEEPDAGTLTVALDPTQALALISAQEVARETSGRVWAILRNFGDDQIVEIPARDVILVEN